MRTPIRTAVVVAMLLGLVPLLSLAPHEPAANAAGSITISNTEAGRPVQAGSDIAVRGTVPPEGSIERADLVGLSGTGREIIRIEQPQDLVRPAGQGSYLDEQNGAVTGELGLPCEFGNPQNGCAPEERIRQVVLDLTYGGVVYRSNPLRVDADRPYVRGYELVRTDQIRVVFSEPVTRPDGESPTDWRVSEPDREVIAVSEAGTAGDCKGRYGPDEDPAAGDTGCTRLLTLDRAVAEDAEPRVAYAVQVRNTSVSVRERHEDAGGLQALASNDGANSLSVDLVRPAKPEIASVAGNAPSASGTPRTIAANDASGEVEVRNLTAGHQARLDVIDPDGVVTVTPYQTVAPGASSVRIPISLTKQGRHLITAVALDPHGNLSTDATQPGRTDSAQSSVAYVLDTIEPRLAKAVADGSTVVVVTFTEAVNPAGGAPADWVVRDTTQTYPVTAVEGSGETRRLTVTGTPTAGTVEYRPAATAARYTDAAQNGVPSEAVTLNGIPLPRVTSPVSERVEPGLTAPVTGTAAPGALVRLHRNTAAEGAEPVAGETVGEQQLPAGATAFELVAPLTRDTRNRFAVTATDTSTGVTSRAAAVGTIVQDSLAPTVTVSAPTPGTIRAGGTSVEVTYRVQDANPGPVAIELSTDGGATWQPVPGGPFAHGDGQPTTQNVQLPKVDTERAVFRVTSTDKVGRVGSATSSLFVIDAVTPAFTARTTPQSARTVRVVFTEPLPRGDTQGPDWRVGSQTALTATFENARTSPNPVLVLTVPQDLPRNEPLPDVSYRPQVPTALREPLRDRAGQDVLPPTQVLVDGIPPAAPTVTGPSASQLTSARTVVITGTGEPGSAVEAVRIETGQVASEAATVGADGRWSVSARLLPDVVNRFQVRARDSGNNTSAGVAVPTVTQDASGPTVAIDAPATGTRLEPGAEVRIVWRTEDQNPADLPVTVLVSTNGGADYSVLARSQPASSSLLWSVPQVSTDRAVVRIDAIDRVGNTTARTTGFLGIGQAAAGGAPPPPPPTGGTPPPPPPPAPPGVDVGVVTASVNDRTITAGNAPLISGTATDREGRPVAGQPVRVFQKVWGSSSYTTLETGQPVRTDDSGRYAFRVRPDRQRSYVVQVGEVKSRPLVIAVFNRVNVAQPVGGAAIPAGTTTVVGDLDPDFASVRVGVAVLRNGRFTYVTQGVTDRTGAYRIAVRGLPRGEYALVVYTSARQGTGAGAASRAVRVS